MKDFYLYISSRDSVNLFPSNNPNEFKVNLCRNINLIGDWECGLKEIYFNATTENSSIMYITCDNCERSYAANTYMPLLRRIILPPLKGMYSEEFGDTFYKSVTEHEVSNITISIRGSDGLYRGLNNNQPVFCILHFKKV